jgi:large subunit ribosomal protein L15
VLQLNTLRPPKNSIKKKRRVGRGIGSGKGKTCGRGTKGQLARSKVRPGFEGGQMPLYRRLPKRGFVNFTRKVFSVVNVSSLNKFDPDTEVNEALLIKSGLVKNPKDGIKILGKGKIRVPLKVKIQRISKQAKEKIEACGGKVIEL